MTLICPFRGAMRFCGLTSRWVSPRSAACCRPFAAWRANMHAWWTGSVPFRAT